MLGEPLPNEEKQQNIDFDTMEEFEFVFDIALAPKFKAEVSAKDKVDYYTIEVSDEMIDNQVKMYTQRTGKYDKVDAYEDNDMLKGLLAQLDEEGNTKEGGIQVEAAVLMPAYMKNDDQKAIFANAKVNDVLVFNPNVAYDGHAAELGSLLKIDKEIAKDVKSDFSFQVEEITRFVPGELTQEVFDQAFGEGVVKTEEEFRAKIKEEIAARFVADSDYKFLIDIRKVMMEKVEDIALVFFLPLFFAFTGLRTEIGLINSPALWGVCLLLITVAVAGKLGGCAVAARLVGESWKDSFTIGTLMNTRGLMELVLSLIHI